MSLKDLTQQEKALVMQDYNNRAMKAIEVRQKWGLSSSAMAQLVVEMGGEFRVPAAHKPRNNTADNVKKCPNCHRKIDLKGAKFCPYCATDIRNEKELTLEKVNKLFSMLILLPASSRDEAQAIITEIDKYIKNH